MKTTKLTTERTDAPDLKAAFQRIQNKASEVSLARATAEAILKSVEKQLIGRRFDAGRSGNLKGEYEITDVDLSWDGSVNAHGRKVTSNGRLGSQRWDLGLIYPGRLGI